MTTPKNKLPLDAKVIFTLTLVHFTGDFYSSFAGPLMPAFVSKLSLSMAQVGMLTGIIRLLSFVVQPLVGYLADRYQTRLFILTGLMLSVVFIPFSGVATGFWSLLLVLGIGSIGSSMFHPSVTGMVPVYSGSKKGVAMSIFNTGGTFAFSVGPVFISWYVARFGLENMPYTMILGLICMGYCLVFLPMPMSEGLKNLGFIGSLKDILGDVWKPILMIWAVMVLRAVCGQAFMTFMPVHLANNGYSLISVGFIVALFILAGTISGLWAGYASDRVGYKPIFIISHTLMAPALLLYLYLPGNWAYLGASMGGFCALASMPLGVLMAQALAPRGRAMVSSLMMGLAYGLGGLFSPLVGKLADIFSIETTLTWVALTPVLSLLFILRFPDIKAD